MTARRTAFSAFRSAGRGTRDVDERLLDGLALAASTRLLPDGAASVAWDVAGASGLVDDERRAFAVIVLTVMLTTHAGSTRLPLPCALLSTVAAEVLAPLDAAGAPIAEALAEPLALARRAVGVVGDVASDRPLLLGDASLAPARLYRAETAIATQLSARTAAALDTARALDDVTSSPTLAGGAPMTLTDEQRLAVATACREGASIITGGPGTGKTSVLVALLRTLVRCGVAPDAIALAAPTGKAAERMTESLAAALASLRTPAPVDETLASQLPKASTLHRLLSYSPTQRRFARGADDPLPHDVVVVDEASMIDVELGRALMVALRADTRVVLLGDPDQLPPVGAGALLQDLAAARPSWVARLTISHRMRASDPAGSAVLSFSRDVARGDVGGSAVTTREHARDVVWCGVEHVDTAALGGLLDRLAERHVELVAGPARRTLRVVDGELGGDDVAHVRRLLALASSVRVLSPVRAGPLGTESLSRGIEQRVERRLTRAHRGPPPGTPVLVVENDYARGLFNGDQGLVVRAVRGATTALEVAFASGSGVSLHPWDALAQRVEQTYALTVHKSQGSECDVVVLGLADVPDGLASRALLYTAVTRAKTGVVLVGELSTLQRRVRAAGERSSSLRELLSQRG